MYGFVNDGASCFLDSLLVALFAPSRFFHEHLLSREVRERLASPDGQESNWESSASADWRDSVFTQLALAASQVDGRQQGSLRSLRALFRRVPMNDANFGTMDHQSAVDALRYILHILRVRDRVVKFQQSVTLFTARAEVMAAQQDVGALVRLWLSSPVVARFTRDTAHLCPDADEREALQSDATGQAYLLVNQVGDMRRVGAHEWASLFLCQLTPQDADSAEVSIDRELHPTVQVLAGQEGYDGAVATKIVATRLLHAPVLLIEVTRKMVMIKHNRLVEFKLPTPVKYGETQADQSVTLRVFGKTFLLKSVVCHLGDTESGHYITYVWLDGQWWQYNDAAYNGKYIPGNATLDAHARQSGELFVYELCV